MDHLTKIETDNLEKTLADLITDHSKNPDGSYELVIKESQNSNCVVVINDDEYILKVAEQLHLLGVKQMELYIKANEYHIEAKIQGNKDSLERLKTTIEMALSRGSACSEGYFDEEGEEYSVLVMLV